ncbi:MAG TPA: molybdenum cofactor guanylyltransferase MobA [Methyloceanibacter sp.]|nr:molybdenum cofactor guanylyltransferase MobA [Methyloceanibacter sp.]
MTAPRTIIGVVRAGGRSSRMGGGDKCLELLGGRPLLGHVIARLRRQVADMVISANGDPARFAPFGLPVVADSPPELAGPIAGVEAALAWVAANCPGVSWIVTVPGDSPFIPGDLVARLVGAGRAGTMAVARSATGVHPVAALWPVGIADDLKVALADGFRRVSRWAELQSAPEAFFAPVEIDGRPVDPFFNINRPEDLAAAEALLARERSKPS